MTTSTLDSRAKAFRSLFALTFLGVIIALSANAVLNPTNPLTNIEVEATNNDLWVLVCASIVFFMQAGFLCYEVGLARQAHTTAVAIKNLVDWTLSSVGFICLGFGLMFGSSDNGLFGTDLFVLDGLGDANTTVTGPTFFLFQLAFAGTAITLISGSLVERTTLLAYGLVSIVIAAIIYPVYGHWVWGNLLNENNEPWLATMGFHDFAGGTVVHLLGATAALVGIKMIGPRIGRFDPNGTPKDMPASNIGLTMLGVIILWFGWWGFNGGSFLAFDRSVTTTIIVTNLCAVAGLVGAGSYAYFFQQRYMMTMKLVGGAVGGLVAITAGADVVTPQGSIAIGLLAGVAVSWSNDYLLKRQIDDALSVIPVHGAAAIVGTLTLPLFAVEGTFPDGIYNQFLVQLSGVAICVFWAAGASYPVYWLVKNRVGLRVAPDKELQGSTLDNNTWPYSKSTTDSGPDIDEEVPEELDWSDAVALLEGHNDS